jgi:hypothetical protein
MLTKSRLAVLATSMALAAIAACSGQSDSHETAPSDAGRLDGGDGSLGDEASPPGQEAGPDAGAGEGSPAEAGSDAEAGLDSMVPDAAGDAPGDALADGPSGDGGDASPYASDPLNCGAAGHDCLGAACLDGMCTPTVLASTMPWDQSYVYPNQGFVDATNLYVWAGSIFAMPKTGGSFVPVGGGIGATKLVFENGAFYFISEADDSHPVSVYEMPAAGMPDGGAPAPFFTTTNQAAPYVYFTAFDVSATTLIGINYCNFIYSPTLAANPSLSIPVDDDCSNNGGLTHVVLDEAGTTAYIPSTDGYVIDQVDLATFTTTATIQLPTSTPGGSTGDQPTAFTRIGSSLYWYTSPSCTPPDDGGACTQMTNVYTMSLSSLVPTLLASTPLIGWGMLTDGQSAYFNGAQVTETTTQSGIFKLPLEAGAPLLMLYEEEDTREMALAIDDSYLYFSNETEVARVAR